MGPGQEEGQGDRAIPCKIPWKVTLAPCLRGTGKLTPDSHPWWQGGGGGKEAVECIPAWLVKGWFSGISRSQGSKESGRENWVLVLGVSSWAAGVPNRRERPWWRGAVFTAS